MDVQRAVSDMSFTAKASFGAPPKRGSPWDFQLAYSNRGYTAQPPMTYAARQRHPPLKVLAGGAVLFIT